MLGLVSGELGRDLIDLYKLSATMILSQGGLSAESKRNGPIKMSVVRLCEELLDSMLKNSISYSNILTLKLLPFTNERKEQCRLVLVYNGCKKFK